MKRRDFMKKTAASGTVLSGMSISDSLFPPDGEAAAASEETYPIVGICASNDPDLPDPVPLDALLTTRQVRDIVWCALDRDTSPRRLEAIVTRDSWVVIKPNIVTIPISQDDFGSGISPNWNLVREEDEGVEHWGLVTDLRVVKALGEYLIERIGPRRITIAEGGVWYSSGGKLKPEKFLDGWHCEWEGFDNLSYAGIVESLNRMDGETQADIVDLNEDDAVYVTAYDPHKTGRGAFQFVPAKDRDGTSDTEPTRRKGIYLPKTIMERDILITCPVLKTHGSVGTTLFMKNFVGCVHSVTYTGKTLKVPIHKGSQFNLARGIADLACAINPDYGVAEGFWATMSMHHGQNGVNIHHNAVIAGGDVVAAEAVANQAMGFNPLDFDLLRMCNMKKLGEWRPDRILVAGPPVSSIRVNYDRAANKYVARGVRKWLMIGPVKKPLEGAAGLKPRLGEKLSGETWRLLDGDAIIDQIPMVTPPFNYKDNLLYPIPGSASAGKNSLFYLFLTINTPRKDLVGQLLIGLRGGEFRAFFNGTEKGYRREPLRYDPTPSSFMKFHQGDNYLVLEVEKVNDKKETVDIAVNICDLDGDRLADVTFTPPGE